VSILLAGHTSVKIEGVRELPAPRERVWSMLMDPAVLSRCLPGCESLEPAGTNSYKATLKVGIAAIKGSFSGTVSLTDLNQPESFKLVLESSGKQGFVRGVAAIKLTDKGQVTELSYFGEGQVGGMLASVGQRMLQGVASSQLHKFFEAFEREVRGAVTS